MIGAAAGNYNYYPIYNHYLNNDNMKVPSIPAIKRNEQQLDNHRTVGKTEKAECQTCKERKYVDGSNDSNVSFKSPGHISASASVAKVSAHEQEHVRNAVKEAAKPEAELISASVKIKMAVCPECGSGYAAGGVTSTQIKYSEEKNPYEQERKKAEAILLTGMNFDSAA